MFSECGDTTCYLLKCNFFLAFQGNAFSNKSLYSGNEEILSTRNLSSGIAICKKGLKVEHEFALLNSLLFRPKIELYEILNLRLSEYYDYPAFQNSRR